MANKNILTFASRASQVEQDYYNPSSTVAGLPVATTYAFLSRVDPWVDDNNPDTPTQDQKYIKQVLSNIFVAKQISTNNINPVIPRRDWTSGVVYDYYQDNVDILALDVNGLIASNFYVRNRYDQVFKCLWNNNGGTSTYEPFFQPGTYSSNFVYQNADGYKWKYMYTIDSGKKKNFMDSNWMPVPITSNIPNPYLTNAGIGNIDAINVTNGGSGYDAINSYIVVNVVGDGTTVATGNVVVSGGAITDITIGNTGQNYTQANVTITAYTSSNLQYIYPTSSGATAIAPVSPIGGHAFDPVSELGCNHVMYVCEFNGSENGNIPTDVDYRQVGLLVNPSAYSTYPNPANAAIYNTSTQLTLAAGFGVYTSDEIIYQGSSLATATFTATALSFNTSTNVLSLINTRGTLSLNSLVYGNSSGTSRLLLSFPSPATDFIPYSGYVTYIENRSGVQRSSDGIEQFKFVLGY